MDTSTASSTNGRERVERLAARLYTEHRPHLFRIAARNSLNLDDAEDSLQDAFVIFVRKYEPSAAAHPLAWLTTVLKRECWGRRRREHLDRRAGQEADANGELGCALDMLPDRGPSPHEAAELSELVAETRTHLAQLKPQERRALSLLALGYSYREIGEITGWTYTKINRCIAEGRADLRKLSSEQEALLSGPRRAEST